MDALALVVVSISQGILFGKAGPEEAHASLIKAEPAFLNSIYKLSGWLASNSVSRSIRQARTGVPLSGEVGDGDHAPAGVFDIE